MTTRVIVHPDATGAIADHAERTEIEAGGLLLGWWTGEDIAVRHALAVADPDATLTSWTREEHRAQRALDEALAVYDHPWLGYVGDWHSHPGDVGPSRQDLRSLRRASQQYSRGLVLFVHRPGGRVDINCALRGAAQRCLVEEWESRCLHVQ